MTTRRGFLTLAAGAAGVALLDGCDARPAPAASPVPPDLLLVETEHGLGVVRAGRPFLAGTAVPTPDGTHVFATAAAGPDTTLTTIETATGRETGRIRLAGSWRPQVASDQQMVALTANPAVTGRAHTTIVVAEPHTERYRLELTGNYEPDAFARMDTGLCVLEWLPPEKPDRYRVKLLGLEGTSGGLFTRDKVPVPPGTEQEMHGLRRQAAYSPGANALYTLYTHQPGAAGSGWDEETDAFVHTLDLTVGWAYCLDLPEPFGTGSAAAHAIAVTPDARRLVVADLSHGRLALADTEKLIVQAVVPVPTGTGTASATVSPDCRWLYLGIGDQIHVVDLETRAAVGRRTVGGEVCGLAVSSDGSRLLVGGSGTIGWWDASSGMPLAHLPVPGLTRLVRTV
jgi:DNA-binding beta-propeller fold protein YncE